MAIRNHNWYNLQSTRGYPVDPGASQLDDSGRGLPSHILVDANLRFPRSLANFAFISGITTTSTLVTVTILGAESTTSASQFVPLAAVTLPKPIDLFRHYPVEALQAGVGGWLVFGAGTEEEHVLRFSTPSQSFMMPRTARGYRNLPVSSLAKDAVAEALQGVVGLNGEGPVEVVKEETLIQGEMRDAIVIRLKQDFANGSILQDLAGPCGGRPESETCNKPAIETVNAVAPDCAGNIDIEVDGVDLAPFESCGGQALDMDMDLDTACDVPSPNQAFDDLCFPKLSSQASFESSLSSVSSSSSSLSVSSESVGCAALPVQESFDEGAPHWDVIQGTWTFESADSPGESFGLFESESSSSLSSSSSSSESSSSSSSSASVAPVPPVPVEQSYVASNCGLDNISLIQTCDDSTIERQLVTDVQLVDTCIERNAGLVLNYKRVGGVFPHAEYYMPWLDWKTKSFRLLQWQGAGFRTLFEVAATMPIELGDWLRLHAEITAGPSAGQATITTSVRNITRPSFPSAVFSLVVSDYFPAVGQFGLATLNAKARFSFFELKEL